MLVTIFIGYLTQLYRKWTYYEQSINLAGFYIAVFYCIHVANVVQLSQAPKGCLFCLVVDLACIDWHWIRRYRELQVGWITYNCYHWSGCSA